MATPTMITISGTVEQPAGSPDTTFRLRMEQETYVFHADGTVLEPTIYEAFSDGSGAIAITVPPTDDPAWRASESGDWTYRCYFDPVEGLQGSPFRVGIPYDLGDLTLNVLIPAGGVAQIALYAPINHTHGGGGGGGSTAWVDITGKPSTFPPSAHTHPAVDISNSTAIGRSVLTAADQAAGRTAIGAGTSSLALGTSSSTALAGDAMATHLAAGDPHPQYLTATEGNSAYDPAGAATSAIATHVGLPDPHPQYLTGAEGDAAYAALSHTHIATAISDSTATGRSVLTAANAAAARTAIGAGTSSLVIGVTGSDAAAGNHTHTVSQVTDYVTATNLRVESRLRAVTDGEYVIPRGEIINAPAIATGTLFVTHFMAAVTETITKIATGVDSIAAVGTTHAWVGILNWDGTNYTPAAVSADTTTLWNAAFTGNNTNLTGPWNKVAGNLYAFFVLWIGSGAAPSLFAGGGSFHDSLVEPRTNGYLTGQTAPPSGSLSGALLTPDSRRYQGHLIR